MDGMWCGDGVGVVFFLSIVIKSIRFVIYFLVKTSIKPFSNISKEKGSENEKNENSFMPAAIP